MPPAHRKGDIGSGHGCHFPPTPATGGSPDVYVNGRPLMRVGDAFAAHACPKHGGGHGRALAEGSATVFINGLPAGREGDAIDCGGQAQTASGNVFIGDSEAMALGQAAQCQVSMAQKSMPFVKG